MSKIFLAVPFERREEAKEMGAFWSPSDKLWFIPEKIKDEYRKKLEATFDKALDNITHLNVKYDDRNDAKLHGCKWDRILKKWYIPRDCSKNNYDYLISKYGCVIKENMLIDTSKLVECES